MDITEIKYSENEQIISNNSNHIKVEIKGIGPAIRVLKKCRIIVTNKRFFITQKMLFSSKYLVQYIIWYKKNNTEKIHIIKGIIETSVAENGISEVIYKDKKITKISVNNEFIKYIKIFSTKENLGLS